MRVVTHYVYPPIPDRRWDWCAVDDDTFAGPGSQIGHGPTEAAAIADLLMETNLAPHERCLLFENEAGPCPVCGALRGFSVPDACADNPHCPEPWDIEASLT